MSKYRKWLLLLLAVGLLTQLPLPVYAAQTVEIGGVYVYMPEVRVEVKGDLPEGDISAQLASDSLSLVSAEKYDPTDHSTMYYLLVDLSTSMWTDFQTMKRYMNGLVDGLGNKDRVTLVTFGTAVQERLESCSDKDALHDAINGLTCNEGGTLLCEGLKQVYQMATDSYTEFDRQYVIAFSDFADYQVGSTTYAEITDSYASRMLPLYAVCASDTLQQNADQFGLLARSSGGDAAVIGSGIGATVDAMLQSLCEMTLLRFTAETNNAGGTEELLSIQIGSIQKSLLVPVTKMLADTQPPEIRSATFRERDRTFVLVFSEQMKNAEKASAYEITDGSGNRCNITEVVYDSDARTAEITVEAVSDGRYTLSFHGITDASRQENALNGTVEIPVKNQPVQETLPEEEPEEQKKEQWLLPVVGVLAVLILAAIVIVAAAVSKKKQPEEPTAQEQVPARDGTERSAAVQPEASYHISRPKGIRLSLCIQVGGTEETRLTPDLSSSIIFGRAAACDVSIDDRKLSRQHFALEYVNGKVLLSDLHSTNGTLLNGIRIGSRREVHTGDRITAGLTEVRILPVNE